MALLAQFIGPRATLGVSSGVRSCLPWPCKSRAGVTPRSAPLPQGPLPRDRCFCSARHAAGGVAGSAWCQGDAGHCGDALNAYIRLQIAHIAISPPGCSVLSGGDACITPGTTRPWGTQRIPGSPLLGRYFILLFSTVTAGTDPSRDGDDTTSRKTRLRNNLGDGGVPLKDSDPWAGGGAVRTPSPSPSISSLAPRAGNILL